MDMYKVNGINHILDYHLFIRCGDKVYMDVKGGGDIVISFDELQKNKYWKYYYDVSLMITNDKHLVINEIGDGYGDRQFTEQRFWTIDTAYIEGCINLKTKKVKNQVGYTCYYKINPFDVENMEYSSQQDLNVFKRVYMERFDVRSKMFEKRSVYYYTFVFDYCVRLMEKELDEIHAITEDKKNLLKLVALYENRDMNSDVLMMIYDNIVSREGKNRFGMEVLIHPDAIAQILEV